MHHHVTGVCVLVGQFDSHFTTLFNTGRHARRVIARSLTLAGAWHARSLTRAGMHAL
jgi:hypothetical protein